MAVAVHVANLSCALCWQPRMLECANLCLCHRWAWAAWDWRHSSSMGVLLSGVHHPFRQPCASGPAAVPCTAYVPQGGARRLPLCSNGPTCLVDLAARVGCGLIQVSPSPCPCPCLPAASLEGLGAGRPRPRDCYRRAESHTRYAWASHRKHAWPSAPESLWAGKLHRAGCICSGAMCQRMRGGALQIIRAAGMEGLPDGFNETNNLRLRPAGSVSRGQVTAQQVQRSTRC